MSGWWVLDKGQQTTQHSAAMYWAIIHISRRALSITECTDHLQCAVQTVNSNIKKTKVPYPHLNRGARVTHEAAISVPTVSHVE